MAAAKTPGLKELFRELRDEERDHKRLLEGLDPAGAGSLEPPAVEDLGITDGLKAEPPHPDMSFQDVLIFAARKEEQAARLYSGLAAKAGRAEVRRLFEFLAGREKLHKLRLEILNTRDAFSARTERPYHHQGGGRTMEKWECTACGYIYDPAVGDPNNGVPPGTRFEDLPDTWVCPQCGVGKEFFQKVG